MCERTHSTDTLSGLMVSPPDEVMCRVVVPLASMHMAGGSPSEGHKDLASHKMMADGSHSSSDQCKNQSRPDKGIQGIKGSTTNGLDLRLEWTHCKRLDVVTAWSLVEGGLQGLGQAHTFPFPAEASP